MRSCWSISRTAPGAAGRACMTRCCARARFECALRPRCFDARRRPRLQSRGLLPRGSHGQAPVLPFAFHEAAMDFEQARFNMVEQQIRTWEVLDQDVLDLLFEVRREDFVPPAYRSLAFADLEIPIGEGERMWTPKMEARD